MFDADAIRRPACQRQYISFWHNTTTTGVRDFYLRCDVKRFLCEWQTKRFQRRVVLPAASFKSTTNSKWMKHDNDKKKKKKKWNIVFAGRAQWHPSLIFDALVVQQIKCQVQNMRESRTNSTHICILCISSWAVANFLSREFYFTIHNDDVDMHSAWRHCNYARKSFSRFTCSHSQIVWHNFAALSLHIGRSASAAQHFVIHKRVCCIRIFRKFHYSSICKIYLYIHLYLARSDWIKMLCIWFIICEKCNKVM